MSPILVRPVAGVAAANLLMALILVQVPAAPWRAALYSAGWGMALLLGVMSRYIARHLRRVQLPTEGTWSGVLVASLAWQAAATSAFFPDHWRQVLELSVVPIALVYLGAKLGCLHLGCCGWRRGVPLQALEVAWTAFAAAVAVGIPAPAGLGYAVFMVLHVFGWRLGKALRVEAAAPA